jgi:hypothetical protein
MGKVKVYPQAAELSALALERRRARAELEDHALEHLHKARPVSAGELGAELWPFIVDSSAERARRTKRADTLWRRLERHGRVASELRTVGARELRLYRRTR